MAMQITTDSPLKDLALKEVDLGLLANFVHQVVNPLNGIAGTLDNIVEGVILQEEKKEQRLRAARAQLEQCISLMRNMAYFAQGFNRVLDADRRVIVLPQVIIESAMFYQEDAKIKDIKIHLEDRATQNRVSGHPELIRQVLMNIFDNCVKYSAVNSVVTVKQWIQRRTGNAMISVLSTPTYRVTDSDLARLCELGFRGSNATKVVASGTGIGLYISKKIVEDVHGGYISIKSASQIKLEFIVSLPGAVSN